MNDPRTDWVGCWEPRLYLAPLGLRVSDGASLFCLTLEWVRAKATFHVPVTATSQCKMNSSAGKSAGDLQLHVSRQLLVAKSAVYLWP
jgi:hypothetical protein